MIESFLQIGFLKPSFLFLIPPVIGLLVYAYLRSGKARRIQVASTLLLRHIQKRAVTRHKFLPPLRFFVELLLLCMIIFALSQFSRREEGARYAILVDNSLSMSGVYAKGYEATSALKQAKEQVTSFLHSLPFQSQIELFVSSPSLRQVHNSSLSPQQALGELEKIEVVYAGDQLRRSAQSLVSEARYDRVFIVTDKQYIHSDGESSINERVSLTTVAKEKKRENLALTGIRFAEKGAKGEQGVLAVEVRAFTETKVSVVIQLERAERKGQEFSFTPIRRARADLDAGSVEEVLFHNMERGGAYRATLRVQEHSENIIQDSISLDNTALIAPASATSLVAFVGDVKPEQLGLDNIPGLRFQHIPQEEYQASAFRFEKFHFAIFHRFVPETLPEIAALYVLPPIGNASFARGSFVEKPKVTRWEVSHPLVTYLNVPLLSFRIAAPLTPVSWAKNVLSSSAGVLMYAGALDGRRMVVSGFEMFPFEGKKSPVLSVLLLNSFKWLSHAPVSSSYASPYSPLPSALSKKTSLSGEITAKVKGISVPTQPGFLWDKESSLVYAVNFFDPSESNLLKGDFTLESVVSQGSLVGAQARQYTPWLIVFALFLLILDIVLLLFPWKLSRIRSV